jgi:transposase
VRTLGSPAELERRRQLAVQRVLEGYPADEVAEFLGVNPGSVRRWLNPFRAGGDHGSAARAVPGRPPKLTRCQEKMVLRWLSDSPVEFGFSTELWTCLRLARLIREEWAIRLNPQYLSRWLRARDFTPQRPRRVPRERNEPVIAGWLAHEWPRIKKTRAGGTRRSPGSTRAGCWWPLWFGGVGLRGGNRRSCSRRVGTARRSPWRPGCG